MTANATNHTHRFGTLDGLRGLAALAVVMQHSTTDWLTPARGGLAVDLFFILSGFVLAFSYQSRLQGLRDFAPFIVRRVIRLYPLYLFGLGLGVSAYLLTSISDGSFWPTQMIAAAGLNAAFLPVPPDLAPGGIFVFPFNPPGWSLSWEMFISIAFGLAAPFLSNRVLTAILGVSAIGLCWVILSYGSNDLGSYWTTFWFGSLRVIWGFACGVGLYRLFKAGRLPKEIRGLGPIALLILLFVPMPDDIRPFVELSVALVGLPLIVAFSTGPSAGRVLNYLGRISFAVYIVHWPINVALQHFDLDRGTLLSLLITLPVAAILEVADEAFRARLTALVFKRRQPQAAT
ncbi:acyltransferase family protein [Brevundimonas variabilis]|uniref:Peptidoglycan/LPS O-acetylase OafA/YrhL n=1 Tax=Brevundimonas variabilis TaxID=74312 RepID=A0A7W9CLJ9_9CAUL|nr:acyltransferase [Brevundimonas variabilis]MBB5747422.1 peptidoglycan/LPS O-acetylase OafA/YrhL [Brevundimonas variabilis]